MRTANSPASRSLLAPSSREFPRLPLIPSLAAHSLARPFVHTAPAPLFTHACGPRSPLIPSFAAHLLTQPGLARTTRTHSRLVSPKCTFAHPRFIRRYAHFESTIPNSPSIQPYESALIDTSLEYDDQYRDANVITLARAWQRVPNTIASPVACFQKIGFNDMSDGDSSAWGKAVATVDASHTRVFSYIWNQHSYEQMNRHADKEGAGALNKIVFPPDSHSMLRALVLNFGLAVSARVFSTWYVWRQERDKSFAVAFAPMSDYKRFNSATVEINNALDDQAAAAEVIRGTVKGFWRIKPLAPEGK